MIIDLSMFCMPTAMPVPASRTGVERYCGGRRGKDTCQLAGGAGDGLTGRAPLGLLRRRWGEAGTAPFFRGQYQSHRHQSAPLTRCGLGQGPGGSGIGDPACQSPSRRWRLGISESITASVLPSP